MTVESAPVTTEPTDWWRHAVVYQIYIRSFADGNGDGVGDIAGIRSRLPYLADLGVDALWITPWYRSPMADGGYDVADFRAIAPEFGTLTEAERLIEEIHEHGLRLIVDIVPNHTSDRHRWFADALTAGPGSPERARYWFRPGRGPDGALPPNDWHSVFGGPAWTRLPDHVERRAEWYLHLFAPEQPDLNWTNPEVRAEFESILRFWFDRGIDGLRLDVAHGLAKHPLLPDIGLDPGAAEFGEGGGRHLGDHPHWDRDEVHEIYRDWRQIADSYAATPRGARMFVAEAWRIRTGGLARYLRPGELHTAFNFDFLKCPWNAGELRTCIDDHLAALTRVGAPATWVLSSHDLTRHVTRYGLNGDWTRRRSGLDAGAVDLALGTRRARAAALLMLALPGSAYLYQGEELGLPEVDDLPSDVLQDPIWERSGHRVHGRDGCRVPLPWSGAAPALGFGTAKPWLPQPPQWRELSVEAQTGDPDSTLELYRTALRFRRAHPALGEGLLRWLEAPAGVIAFGRGAGFTCLVNLTARPVPLPVHDEIHLTSRPLDDHLLPPDTAVWLHAR
ncbi:alpha-amylase family glycosyl hydrolase [Sphaerisporangium dianthi]|uniref:Alpha-amylase family glycosyl hydrolase n=1 Tax=Sphaerisporangium dianthi TaxID=1436120 RepID=A0ABV9CVQ2_9ACTN